MPAFWLYLGLLLLAGALILFVQFVYATTAPVAWTLSWMLLLLYIVPVVLVVRRLDLYEREPRSLVIGAFLWGGCIAILFSGFGNDAWGNVITRLAGAEFASEWSAALTAPIVEEIYKVLGVVVLYLIARNEFDDIMDGFVFGAMVGLGFSVVEDVDYFINAFGGTVVGVLVGFWVRVIASGLYGHVLYTGLSGIGVAYFVTRRGEVPFARRFAVAAGLLLLAMGAHFFWNSPLIWEELPLFAATAVKGMPFLIVLGICLRLARRREHRWLAAALETEVGRPGLTTEELETLREPSRRKQARKKVKRAGGRAAERLFRDLERKQIDLSMIATRVDRPDHPDLVKHRNDVRATRDKLWSTPGVVEALGVSPATIAALRAQPLEMPFSPEGAVGPAGLAWWSVPDGNQPPSGRIDPGVPLMIVDRSGDWARVRASNGWLGWVDGRLVGAPRPADGWER
jgi:RsiW-degrading membrane proteinase PrsW (M82 family)